MPDSQVIQGDCLEVMRGMAAGSADLVFCDPPYNLGIDYGDGEDFDIKPFREYLAWSEAWIRKATRLLKPYGSMWVLISEQWADDIGGILCRYMPDRRNRIIWRERFGQYNENKFPSGHRHLFYHIGPGAFTWNPDVIRVPSERMRMGDKRAAGPRVPDDVWEVSRLQGNDGERIAGHPCQLRRWPLERIILACTNPGDTVLDPMCGSGTMGIAATQLGRNFIGIELNPDYCEMTRQRIANPEPGPEMPDAPGQLKMFEEAERGRV